MDDKKHRQALERSNYAFGISPMEWVTAGVMGFVSAVVAAGVRVRDHFGDELKKWPGIEQLNEAHKRTLIDMNREFMEKPTNWSEHKVVVDAQKNLYALDRDTMLLEKYGIYSRGIKGLLYGTYQRIGFLGKTTKNDTLVRAALATFLGTGVTVSFFNGVATRDKIEKIEDLATDVKDALAKGPPDAATLADGTAPAAPNGPSAQNVNVVKQEKLAAHAPVQAGPGVTA